MEVLLLTFANSETDHLPSLREEDDKVNTVLSERIANGGGDFSLVREQYATRENIVAALKLHRNDIGLFWYSGHADSDRLELGDGVAHAGGIAALLGDCPRLKLVGLNGCSTAGQVDALIDKGIPIIIATTASVGDKTAKQFSIAFFTELAKNRLSIREAFEKAVKTANVYGKIEAVTRSAGRAQQQDPKAPLWQLIYTEKDFDLLDTWRLPDKLPDAQVNKYLHNALNLLYKYQRDSNEKSDAPIDELLKRLPFTISEPIRKLLAPRGQSEQDFYDRPSPKRYGMLLYAYHSIGNFLAFALLSHLWKIRSSGKVLTGLEELWGVFSQWLGSEYKANEMHSMMPFFNRLVAVLKDNETQFEKEKAEIPLFFPELEKSLQDMDQPETQLAFASLEQKLMEPSGSRTENWVSLCDDTEKQLALVLFCFGFLFRYNLTSVKNIDVLFYLHNQKPTYAHTVVRLQQQMSGMQDNKEELENPRNTAAVLLRHVSDKNVEMYVSPFIIDYNAYTRTAKANPRFCVAYNKLLRTFYFKSVSNPDVPMPPIKEQKQLSIQELLNKGEHKDEDDDIFPLIHGQFSAFCSTVFGKTLDDL
ncbi:MAG: hypothetical protein ACKVT2_22315 [Saprospiraceae bacterium]